MTVLTQVDLGTLARVGTALADPTRRRVLVQLIDGPGYPAEMADSFGITRANLSNHLTCLRECGLVTATAEGRRVRYELADQQLAEGDGGVRRAGRQHAVGRLVARRSGRAEDRGLGGGRRTASVGREVLQLHMPAR